MFNVPCACELDFLYQYQNTSQAVDFDIASSQSAGFWVLQMSYIPHNKRAAPAAAAAPAVQLQTLMCLHKWQNAHDLIIQNPQVLTIGSPLHNAFVSAQSIGDVPPLKLIQRIIAISPQSICQTSNDQGTVLHRLLRCQIIPGRPTTAKSKESIARILIDANPNCLRIADSNGWLPLHVLCAHARNPEFLLQPDFLRLIIQPFAESISTENKGGVTPISMLLSNSIYGLDGDCQISTHMIEAQYYNSASTCNYAVMNKYVNELRQWQCVILMLQAADGNIKAVPTPSDLPLHLFAASSLASCQLLAIASVIHKRDILIQDGKGNLPLHLACHKRHSREEIEYPFSKVGILVKLCPEASKMKNTKGYLPLFLAVENYACDWENGMEHLVQSYPDSLAEKYPDHQIYPFMMLASKYNKQEEHQHQQNSLLSCLYHFIRAYPDLICHY